MVSQIKVNLCSPKALSLSSTQDACNIYINLFILALLLNRFQDSFELFCSLSKFFKETNTANHGILG